MPIPQQAPEFVRMTAKERVFQTLQEWVVNGTLEPGERLNDAQLAQHFAVSRTPVREALQLLSEQKLVQIVPACGTFVAPVDCKDLYCVYSLLAELQAIALSFALTRVTLDEFDRLTQLNEEFLRCARHASPDERSKADFAFHHYLCGLSRNPYLVSYSDQLSVHARRGEIYFFNDDTLSLTSYNHHKQIIEALKTCDLTLAQNTIRQNWQQSIDLVTGTPNPD